MLTHLIGGILLIVFGLSLIYTSLNLWWLFLGVPIILFGIVLIIHSFSIKNCWQRIFEGDEEVIKQLGKRINKLKKMETK